MCGISGYIHADAQRTATTSLLEAMNNAQQHRGPDDAAIWCKGPAGLAHRRLSILDPSPAGRQPFLSQDGNHALVFNGEIYNFQELRTTLEKQGCVFTSHCDTEVVLHALRIWGDDALQQFNGMFALAYWNATQKRLLLARDRLGIKPLHYTWCNGVFAFASELGALSAGGFTNTDALNPAALDAYFSYLYIPAPDTIYEGVHKLRPAEKLVFQQGAYTTETYWQVAYTNSPMGSFEECTAAFADLLKDSIALRRISDVPLGAFLSGGLDSSTVVAHLSAQNKKPIKTFSIGFKNIKTNELSYAREVAKRFNTDHTEAMLEPDMITLLPQLVAHFGEPFADSSALPMWLVSQVAREQVTVALSGDGGDELFAGYTWAHMNHRVAQYRRCPALLRHAVGNALHLLPASPFVEKLRRFNADTFLSPLESFLRRQTCFNARDRAGLYQDNFKQKLLQNNTNYLKNHLSAIENTSENNQMLHLDTRLYLPDDVLTKVDRMSMAHGLEARVPLLDHRIVEFAATLPFSWKYHRGISKRLMKAAVRDLLPPEILQQRKQGFSIPIQSWFQSELADFFEEIVLAPTAHNRHWLNPDYIRRLFTLHRQGKEHYGHHLWAILCFELWMAKTI